MSDTVLVPFGREVPPGRWTLAVDTGGTFTDCIGHSPEGELRRAKVLSSACLRARVKAVLEAGTVELEDLGWDLPGPFFHGFGLTFTGAGAPGGRFEVGFFDPDSGRLRFDPGQAAGIFEGIGEGVSPGWLAELSTGEPAPVLGARVLTGAGPGSDLPPIALRLGTTWGTNALLEGRGAPVAFFVTRGFGDLLVIGDQTRPDLFALAPRRPPPLHHWVGEVDERIGAGGEVLRPLDLGGLRDRAREALEAGCKAAAVAFLHSYRNPAHEREALACLREAGFARAVASSDLAPFIKLLPRAETAVVDAYLGPLMDSYLDAVAAPLGGGKLTVMTSAGGLVSRGRYRPKDSLLSGPAGGVVGAVGAAGRVRLPRVIAFDMGGTSTDVSRHDGAYVYTDEHVVGRARLMAPALAIETVAAGGGSICGAGEGGGLSVGPASAGATPGPACYGGGGPLTLTDVNLLLGRLEPAFFGIPVSAAEARARLTEVAAQARFEGSPEPLLEGFLEIADERMADAIRKISVREGYDPAGFSLVAFGGAGGMHACAVAEKLGVAEILSPADAGLLSAVGLARAVVEAFAERQVLRPLEECRGDLPGIFQALDEEALGKLGEEVAGSSPAGANGRGGDGGGEGAGERFAVRARSLELRLRGQESSLTLPYRRDGDPAAAFAARYRAVFGYLPEDREIELVAARAIASSAAPDLGRESFRSEPLTHWSEGTRETYVRGRWRSVPSLGREELAPGHGLPGPAVVADRYGTLWVAPGWVACTGDGGSVLLRRGHFGAVRADEAGARGAAAAAPRPEVVERELFVHRTRHLVEEMGLQLRRTALSTNVKERMDFSCALLDAEGRLVVNAPHIPVHLGAMGICARSVAAALELGPGDVAITNHPGFGGSHLPDVTVITPVFSGGAKVGYVASRAHHAEFGGTRPGSMPPDATRLEEEGVVIPPGYLFKGGEARFEELEALLAGGPFPSRAVADNLADVRAQVAANIRGAEAFARLVEKHGRHGVGRHLRALRERAARAVETRLGELPPGRLSARQELDDGTVIAVQAEVSKGRVRVDFSGSSPAHPGNLNATPAIVHSALLYVLRLLLGAGDGGGEIPLNEGLMDPVDLVLPLCFLNPDFGDDPARAPAVVGGNVETSQRIVDALLLATGAAAGSQGTMNNVVFGDVNTSYYETVGGGAGAVENQPGAGPLHTHMTNTAITDPELLEHRYPVRLHRFARRVGSGGAGRFPGGDGALREIEFLRPLSLSLLTQHRREGPYGMAGGAPGAPGRQTLLRAGGTTEELAAVDGREVGPGDRLVLETPGGGAWGEP